MLFLSVLQTKLRYDLRCCHCMAEINRAYSKFLSNSMRVKCSFRCVSVCCVSYPAIDLSFPPAIVSFLGDDFHGVSLSQRQFIAVTG